MSHDTKARLFRAKADPRHPLLITPEALAVEFDHHEVERVADLLPGGVAVVHVEGPLEHKGGVSWWSFFDSYEAIYCRFKNAMEAEDVRAVVLKLDSPGGEAAGMNETARRMRKLAKDCGKPVYAYADECAYSAAYGLACAADEIYLPKSGGLGSVGVIATLCEVTAFDKEMGVRFELVTSGKHKADGNPHVPLSDDVVARVRKRVMGLAKLFWDQVAEARGMTREAVRALEAGVFFGKDAVRVGLADGVMHLDEMIAYVTKALDSGSAASSGLQSTRNSVQSARSSEDRMGASLALMKQLEEAGKALDKAKTSDERRAAASAFAKVEAKYRKVTRSTEEESDEDEEDESESESASESESEASSTGGSSSSSSSSTDSSMSASEEDDRKCEDEAREAIGGKGLRALKDAGLVVARPIEKTGLYTLQRLFRMTKQMTGETTVAGVMGALDGLHARLKASAKLEKRMAKLEEKNAGDERDRVIAKAISDGKLTPGMKAWAKGQSPEALRAFLKHAPVVATTEAEAEHEGNPSDQDGALKEPNKAMVAEWKRLGFTKEDYPRLLEQHNADVAREAHMRGKTANGKVS